MYTAPPFFYVCEGMKNYIISEKSIESMVNCFSGQEEISQVMIEVNTLSLELNFLYLSMQRVETDHVPAIFMRQIIQLVTFYKENMDLMMELIRTCDCVEHRQEDDADDEEDEWDDNDPPWLQS